MSWGTLMISWGTIIISWMTCTQDIVHVYPRYHKCTHDINLIPTTSSLLPTISFYSPRHQICTHDMHVPQDIVGTCRGEQLSYLGIHLAKCTHDIIMFPTISKCTQDINDVLGTFGISPKTCTQDIKMYPMISKLLPKTCTQDIIISWMYLTYVLGNMMSWGT